MKDKLIRIFFWLTTPIQKFMQKVAPPEPMISASAVAAISGIALPGDVLSSRESLHLTANFIKGFWKHSAIVGRDPNTKWLIVIEAVGNGVQVVDLIEWLYKKDYVKLQRRLNYTPEKREECAMWAFNQKGLQYDYEFSKDDKAFYCSELVADALDIPLNGIIEPTELTEMKEYVHDLFDSRTQPLTTGG
jgi:uncharacterized protein YycO